MVCANLTLFIVGHTTNELLYKWLTNKSETTVLKNEIVIPQFDLEKIEITSNVRQIDIGRHQNAVN